MLPVQSLNSDIIRQRIERRSKPYIRLLFPEDTENSFREQSAFSAAIKHGIRRELAIILRQEPYREVF